jgi:hypothetical protein
MTWEQFWADISVLQAAGWVVAAALALGFVVKSWPFVRNMFRILDALVRLPEFMEDITEKTNEIHHEVKYNNGSSVKDAIARVEATVHAIRESQPKPRAKSTTPKG